MGQNFHTPYTTATTVSVAGLTPPMSSLDKAITYYKNLMVHCDGGYDYVKSTGVLSWDSTIRILFIREDGVSIQNTIASGSITLADNEFAYVTLSETNNATLTVSKASASPGSASNFLELARLVLAYRNSTSDDLYPVALQNKVITKDSLAWKRFWSGTQAAYDGLGSYDSDTLYFITP